MNAQAHIAPPPTITAVVATADLRRALSIVMMACDRRVTIPVLAMLKVETTETGLLISANNLDIMITAAVDAEVTGSGLFMINGQTLVGFTAIADELITMTRLPEWIEKGRPSQIAKVGLSSGGFEMLVNEYCPPEDFPGMFDGQITTEVDGVPVKGEPLIDIWLRKVGIHVITPDYLLRAINLSRGCVSTEETWYYLNGIFVTRKPDGETLRAVATDGHRMAVIDTPIKWTFEPAIVPRDTVRVLRAILSRPSNEAATLALGDNKMRFQHAGITVLAKLIDGTFPDYTRVIPSREPTFRAEISRTTVARLLRAAQGMERNRTYATKIDPDKRVMTIDLPTVGTISAPISGDGGNECFGVNLRLLVDMSAVAGDFTMRSTGGGDPAIIRGEDAEAFWIIMPMRV